MLTFELSAIDLTLAIAVVILFIMYITKLDPKYPDQELFLKHLKKEEKPKRVKIRASNNYEECPRGFGIIKRIDKDNTISERCLGCYKIMECYNGYDIIQ